MDASTIFTREASITRVPPSRHFLKKSRKKRFYKKHHYFFSTNFFPILRHTFASRIYSVFFSLFSCSALENIIAYLLFTKKELKKDVLFRNKKKSLKFFLLHRLYFFSYGPCMYNATMQKSHAMHMESGTFLFWRRVASWKKHIYGVGCSRSKQFFVFILQRSMLIDNFLEKKKNFFSVNNGDSLGALV